MNIDIDGIPVTTAESTSAPAPAPIPAPPPPPVQSPPQKVILAAVYYCHNIFILHGLLSKISEIMFKPKMVPLAVE